MCVFIKKKHLSNKEYFPTMQEIRKRIDEENRAAERLAEWELEQIANGNGEKLFALQAAIEADVREIFDGIER